MRGKLVAVIGDENTCTGFLLAGVGETNKGKSNFFVVDSETPKSAIEECFTKFMDDDNVAVVVINQDVAEEIRHLLDANDRQTPAVVEIPSKDKPYDPSSDSILQRAMKMFSADELR
ncbi:V-type proton ATPase subunit F-like [Convolutriloba macropyga]|uniref:V-type proton ATPase subunit F-like n=1 Tax=Convolutriloba macropyga TaxID=536237 RepID=UPI003F5279C2